MLILIAGQRLALAVIVVGMALLLGSALMSYVVPESRAAQTARLQQTMEIYRTLDAVEGGR